VVATVAQNLRAEGVRVRTYARLVNVGLSGLSLGEGKRARMQDGSAIFVAAPLLCVRHGCCFLMERPAELLLFFLLGL